MWGPHYDSDFWTALAEGEVAAPERRAVKLLQSISDAYRFGLYCYTGHYPAMGNLTKRTYMVKHEGGVSELHDGCLVANWCVVPEMDPIGFGSLWGGHSYAGQPKTDTVISIKNMIEGSENKFWKIGNRNTIRDGVMVGCAKTLQFGPNPFEASINDMTAQDFTEMTLDHLDADTARWITERPQDVARAIRGAAAGVRREFFQG